jgi:subtilisin family serine protease
VAVAQLKSGMSIEQMKGVGAAVTDEGEIDAFITGTASRAELEALGVKIRTEVNTPYGVVRTAYIPASAIDQVAGLQSVSRIEGAVPTELEIDVSVPGTNASNLRGPYPNFTPGLAGQGVLVGDVDSGVDYNHPDFLDQANNSRFVSIWDQTVASGPAPLPYGYGTDWTTAQLTANLSTQTNTDGHGSHVMGIAGGDGSGSTTPGVYVGMAPLAPLCMVKTNFQNTGILDGVDYVFGRATALGMNAVCNLSLGSHFGPHDGTDAFEAGLSGMCGPGRIIVKSAGNERSPTNIRHGQVNAAGAGTNMTVVASGANVVGRVFAYDGYYESTEEMDLRITTPAGTVIGPISLGGTSGAFPGVNTANGNVYVENGLFLTATGDKEVYIEINIASGDNGNGTWTFTFIPVTLGPSNGEVDLWRFFASTSLNANFAVGADNNTELVSQPGNAVELITTAAWTSKQTWIACNGTSTTFTGTPLPGNLATFSSMGPTRDNRQKPDIAAPGIAIASTRSFDQAQSCPAVGTPNALVGDGLNHIYNAGTSMAAPHTTGAAALIMQKYGAVTPAFIKNFLATRAIVDGFTGAVPNIDWGYGKLWLGDMLDPSVAVTYANGGEILLIGGTANLQWTASDNVGVSSVDLHLSRNGLAGPWENIALSIPNSGSYLWVVTGPPTVNAILRVTANDAAGNNAQDVSDLPFTIQDLATATLLSTFEAGTVTEGIELRWRFSESARASNITVERAEQNSSDYRAIPVTQRDENGLTIAVDANVVAGRTYQYRLTARMGDGSTQTFGPLLGTAGEAITQFALGKVWPNPSTGAMIRVDYAVPRTADVSVKILDIQGRDVATLVSGTHRPGRLQAVWTGQINGRPAPSGLYFVQMKSGAFSQTQRVVVSN